MHIGLETAVTDQHMIALSDSAMKSSIYFIHSISGLLNKGTIAMNIEFHGKTVIVTGAAHGFGRALRWPLPQLGRQRVGVRQDGRRTGRDGAPRGRCGGSLHRAHRGCNRPRRRSLPSCRSRGRQPHQGTWISWSTTPAACWGRWGVRWKKCRADDWHVHHRRQPGRGAFFFAQAVAPGMKNSALGPHHQHLQRRGLGAEPDRHPGLRLRQGRADQPDPPALLTNWASSTSPSTTSRRALCAPIPPPKSSGSPMARTGRRR